MCQLDGVTGYPDVWSNIILGVPVRVFLDKMNIFESADQVKHTTQSTKI